MVTSAAHLKPLAFTIVLLCVLLLVVQPLNVQAVAGIRNNNRVRSVVREEHGPGDDAGYASAGSQAGDAVANQPSSGTYASNSGSTDGYDGKENEAPKSKPQPSATSSTDKGPRKPSWRDHPVYKAHPDTIVPPILAWYTTRNDPEYPESVYAIGRYTQQASRYNLMQTGKRGTEAAKVLNNYDLLALGTWGATGIDNWLEFETTRDSQVCLVMSVQDSGYGTGWDEKMSVPPGYTPLGVAKWDDTEPMPKSHKFSSFVGTPIPWAYVACKQLPAGVHEMPSVDKMQTQYRLGSYNLLFSEKDGSAPALTQQPPGWNGPEIKAHELCPHELHDMWTVESQDKDDHEVSSKMWQTWHPQKDYLYGCYYGHEHGCPGMLAGYTERLHYTALKNNYQNESHDGFKGYVIPAGDKYVYFNVHAESNLLSRVDTQFHTMVIAITDKSSGNLLFEMSCKADFGGSAAEYAPGQKPQSGPRMLPLGNEESRQLIMDMYNKPSSYFDRKMRFKRLNVYSPGHLDYRLEYEPDDVSRGIYEQWVGGGGQYCMESSEKYMTDGIQVDIKDSNTACKTEQCHDQTILGRGPTSYRDYFFPNLGCNRGIVFRHVTISRNNCKVPPPKVGADGVYYTDQYCSKLCDGPGPNCVRQVMKPEFDKVTLHGSYAITDVHGHNVYQIGLPGGPDDFENEIRGLRGFQQYEGALGIVEPGH